jgi:hypothetical protein
VLTRTRRLWLVPGLVSALRCPVGGSGGVFVVGDGDGDAEGLQALDVGADLLVPAGTAGIEVRAEVAVAGGGVGQQVPGDDHDGAGDGDLGDGLAAAAGDAPVPFAEEGGGAGGADGGLPVRGIGSGRELNRAIVAGLIIVEHERANLCRLFATDRDRRRWHLRRELLQPGTPATRVAEIRAELNGDRQQGRGSSMTMATDELTGVYIVTVTTATGRVIAEAGDELYLDDFLSELASAETIIAVERHEMTSAELEAYGRRTARSGTARAPPRRTTSVRWTTGVQPSLPDRSNLRNRGTPPLSRSEFQLVPPRSQQWLSEWRLPAVAQSPATIRLVGNPGIRYTSITRVLRVVRVVSIMR